MFFLMPLLFVCVFLFSSAFVFADEGKTEKKHENSSASAPRCSHDHKASWKEYKHKKTGCHVCKKRKKWNLSGSLYVRKQLDVSTKEETDENYKLTPKYRLRIKGTYKISPHFEFVSRFQTGAHKTHSSYNSFYATSEGRNNYDGATFGLNQVYVKAKLFPEKEEAKKLNAFFQFGRYPLPVWLQTDAFWDSNFQVEAFSSHFTFFKNFYWNFGYSIIRPPRKFYSSLLQLEDFLITNQVKWNQSFGSSDVTLAASMGNMVDKGKETLPIELASVEGTKKFPHTQFYLASAQWKIFFSKAIVDSFTFGLDGLMSSADNGNKKNSRGFVAFVKGTYKSLSLQVSHYNIGEASVPFVADESGTENSSKGYFFSQNDFYSPHQAKGWSNTGFSGERYKLDWAILENLKFIFTAYRSKIKKENLFAAYQGAEGYDTSKSSWRFRSHLVFLF